MEFILKEESGRKEIFAELAKSFTVRTGKPHKIKRTLFDTFDWRLYAAGQRLEEVVDGESLRSELLDISSGKVLFSMSDPVGTMAYDWHPAPLAVPLARTIKMRALLPLAMLDTTRWLADLLDEREKTVVRLSVEISKTGRGSPKSKKLTLHMLRLLPVRGYSRAFDQAVAILTPLPCLARAEHSMLDKVLSAYGRTPLDYTSKIHVKLLSGIPAEEAVRLVLLRLTEIMTANHGGVVADIDSEFLHDFRVAVRRTRSMLGQMKASVPAEILKKFRPGFGWLGTITGPTRDLDVYILKFDDYVSSLDESIRCDLLPLKSHILRRQQQEQRKLSRAISSKRYKRFIAAWENILRPPWTSDSESWKGDEAAEAVAGQRILKIHKQALLQGAALTDDSPAPAVHALRITCKKLRYMMEFFKTLYPAVKIDALTGVLKELQDNLGDFQDYEVHRAGLYIFAGEMAAQKTAGFQTLLAIGRLAENLSVRQQKARADLCRRFAEFAAEKNTARFNALFTKRSPTDENSCNL